ncbi:hypothetical protein FSP39_016420 [Pinctada imbricata]|uniref:G-protein coupled receptors family 1 profile domain-containing protein n=1 Tax=Pinctada imbricata TaxID=66713 RepID=A0AA88Y0T8_PINIB|nr:hypothetical protein FSP39_016420 [Pinctada imbricata]
MQDLDWIDLLKSNVLDKSGKSECTPNVNNIHERIKQVILIPLTVLIILFNVLILLCLIWNRKFHTQMYFLVATLGVADLFVGCVSIATLVTWSSEEMLDNCLIRIGFTVATCIASMFSLMLIAIERFIAISYSLWYRSMVTRAKLGVAVTFVWVLSLGIGFLPLMGWRTGPYRQYCSFLYVLPEKYILLTFTVGAVIPIAIMCTIYVKLFKNARIHIKRIEAVENVCGIRKSGSDSSFRVSSRSMKSIKTVVIVYGCVLVTWCPFLIATVVQISRKQESCILKDLIGTHLLLLGFSNSFLNPLIYVVRTKDFRNFITGLCQRRSQRSWII